ncbi:disulfide isomerase DsbC N-terminal domain-containing protein [Aeromonas caviae]|uniref:disulfide isomerase DsbC N-terminal domain-containing protein n=1 Tax=Aeromonas caviae TaxID=648 RepID=UPI0029D4D005|nr:disulfide isomerase DsbC N-terminal domain-containing protein [Aeromonas caviae]MDX7787707.1 disulfide isomerase DsbC N-terminal domain-containing protein [Aeromonas caviae]
MKNIKVNAVILIISSVIALAVFARHVYLTTNSGLEAVQQRFVQNFPKSKDVKIKESPIAGLYEVISSTNLYYTDTEAKLLFVGGIYDPSIQRDITVDRKRALGILPKETSKEGHISTEGRPTLPTSVPADALEKIAQYAITLHDAGPEAPVIYEIFDPQCGYCTRLYSESKSAGLNATIRALLIPNISDKNMTQDVFCSNEPLQTIENFAQRRYVISGVKTDCDTAGLQKIYDFYNQYFTNMPKDPNTNIRRMATPILYDGRSGALISEGYLDQPSLNKILDTIHKAK